jgi:hypothetical protein
MKLHELNSPLNVLAGGCTNVACHIKIENQINTGFARYDCDKIPFLTPNISIPQGRILTL